MVSPAIPLYTFLLQLNQPDPCIILLIQSGRLTNHKQLNMRKLLLFREVLTNLVIVSWVLLFISCTAAKYAYTPSTANLLQLEGKNDFKAAMNFATAASSTGGEAKKSSTGIDIQTAYAVNERIVVKADGYSKGEQNRTAVNQNGLPDESIKYKKQGIEMSIGCNNFSKNKKRTAFQVFGGMGTGKFSFTGKYNDGNPDNHHSMNYFKVFLQPSYTIFVSKTYDMSFGVKLNRLNFSKVTTDYSDILTEPLGFIDSKPNFFIDVVMQHQFGFSKLPALDFQVQLGITSLATSFSSPQNTFTKEKYDYNNSWFAVGVIFNTGKMAEKK